MSSLSSTRDNRNDELLTEAANGDPAKLRDLRARVLAGEPPPYAAGFMYFRRRRFLSDPRAYVTDPEVTHLVDAVASEAAEFAATRGRPPVLLEFGTGAGTLAISLKREHPEWSVCALDVDPAALELAQANAQLHEVALTLFVSDYLSGWPASMPPPDLVFGDPPWGGETDLYSDDRDAEYYHRMPSHSAYPGGSNPCAIHDQLIATLRALHWPSRIVLNYGVLSPATIERSTALFRARRIVHPIPALTIVSGFVT